MPLFWIVLFTMTACATASVANALARRRTTALQLRDLRRFWLLMVLRRLRIRRQRNGRRGIARVRHLASSPSRHSGDHYSGICERGWHTSPGVRRLSRTLRCETGPGCPHVSIRPDLAEPCQESCGLDAHVFTVPRDHRGLRAGAYRCGSDGTVMAACIAAALPVPR